MFWAVGRPLLPHAALRRPLESPLQAMPCSLSPPAAASEAAPGRLVGASGEALATRGAPARLEGLEDEQGGKQVFDTSWSWPWAWPPPWTQAPELLVNLSEWPHCWET